MSRSSLIFTFLGFVAAAVGTGFAQQHEPITEIPVLDSQAPRGGPDGPPCTPVWSDEFYAGDFDGPVYALAWLDNGSGGVLYAGGDFQVAGGVPANRVARWDGTAWAPLGSGVNNYVQTLAIFDDGSGPALYAAGAFSRTGGSVAMRVAKWNGSV